MDTSAIDPILADQFRTLKVFDDQQSKCNDKLSTYDMVTTDLKKNDIYVIYRREALEMKRLASQHFELAEEAYKKGEHLSAKQYSRTAREESNIARELNFKAATEILKFNNCKNGIWRLDLHGLHAKEAIQALQVRLKQIESGGFEFFDSIFTKPKRHLQVITGVGKHSKGKPVLPITVRKFLNENSYRFEEMRPGVLKVWLNFHLRNNNIQTFSH